MTLLELHYERLKARVEAADLLNRVVAEGRDLTIPERVRFDGLTARIAELDTAIAERESLRKLVH